MLPSLERPRPHRRLPLLRLPDRRRPAGAHRARARPSASGRCCANGCEVTGLVERGGRAAGVLVRDVRGSGGRVRGDGGERGQRHRRLGRPPPPRRALRGGGGAAHPPEPRHSRDALARRPRRGRRRDRACRRRAHGVRAALAGAHARRHHRQRLRGRRSSTYRPRTRTWTICSTPSTSSSATSLGAQDLTGAYAGVRPLISTGDPKKSVDISRKAELYETSSGLVTITGGKLTTWRRMAKMAVDRLVEREGREAPCRTHEIPLGAADRPGRAARGRRVWTSRAARTWRRATATPRTT